MVFLKPLPRRSISVLVGLFLLVGTTLLPAQSNCPDVQINFNIPAVVCFDPNSSLVDLEVEVIGGDGTGTGQWSGQNITNTTNGFFRTTFATPGQQKVYYTHTEGNCTYQDSSTFLYSKLSTPVFLASSEQAGHLCQDSFSILRVISNYDEATTNLVWDLDGGTATELGGPDSLHVKWTSPGSKLIQLQYEQYGCLSQPIIQQVVLDPVIDTPTVACDNTLERVVYEWEDPPNSSATVVFVIAGPNGVADTLEDRYTIEPLMPGQFVQVRLVTTSNNTCDGNNVEPICASITCDGDLIDLAPIDKVCVSGGQTDTIDLDYMLYDTITASTLTWSGAGVFDPSQPRIAVDPSMAGQTNWVYVEFQSANCYVRDSVSFELIPPPVADFTIPSTACEGESVTAEFSFGPLAPDSDTTLIWDFGDAEVSGDPNTGTASLSWTTPGSKTVSLAIQDGACVSAPVYRFVNVVSGPEPLQVECAPGPNSVSFKWQIVPAATYDVTILEGPDNGTFLSTTSYRVTGLAPNETVTIEITTNVNGICNTRTVTSSCTPVVCPDVTMVIEQIPPVCASANPDPVPLNATVSGGDGTGILRWSGPNVSGNTWTPDLSLSGQTLFLYAEYQEGDCIYLDSMEIEVLEQPVADFNLDATTCITDITPVEAIGNFPTTADFEWTINGLMDDNLVGPGPHDLNWNIPGNQQVRLIVSNGQCSSAPISRTIQVQSALPEPVISCEPDTDQILFTWDPVPGAMEYLVEVLKGPAGSRTSDTSIIFTGLTPGQEVEISVVLENGGACGNSSALLSCMALGCHDASVNIDRDLLPATVCIGQQDSVFQLDANVTTGIGTGTLVFSGTGVSDLDRTWIVTPAMPGQIYTITATFTEDGCTFTDEVNIPVNSAPTADFTIPAIVCPGDPVSITYTGQASPGADFQWSDTGLSGPGPHILSFDQAGLQTVSLMVSEADCGADFLEQSVEVLSVFPEPVISCDNGLDEVVFTWTPSDAPQQEVLYSGPGTGTQTSDTSFVVSGLDPETAIDIEVQFRDDAFPCRNSMAMASCSSDSCTNLTVDWSAPSAVCAGDPLIITFTTQGAGSSGFDVVIQQDGQTTTHSGINNGSTLNFDLNVTGTFNLISAGIPGNTACSVTLPDPLTISVDEPVTTGSQSIFPSFCEETDTLIQLNDLFSNALPTGQWSFQSGPENPGTAFDPAMGSLRGRLLSAGTYSFQYQSVTNNACPSISAAIEVEILDTPTADAGPDLGLDCQFNIASLGSNLTTPGMSYQWSGSDGTAIADPDLAITEVSQAGDYTLMVINPANGCSASDEVTVSAAPGMIIPYATIVPVTCYGNQDGMIVIDSIVGGRAPYQFTLNGSEQGTRSAFGNLPAGSYDIQVSSDDGCKATLLLSIEAPVQLALELTTDLLADESSITLGDSVELTAQVNIPIEQIATINWLPEAGTGSGASLSQMVHPVITSSYGVEIIDVNGCSVSDRLSIVVSKDYKVFMATAFSPNEDGSNDIFYLQSDQTIRQVNQFSIYNRWGKQVFANQNFLPNDPAEGWNGETHNLPQPPGVYVFWAELELSGGEVIQISGDVALIR